MGSCSSQIRDLIMRDLWTFCHQNNIWLTVVHISGILNREADESSHKFNDRTEWELPQVLFQKIWNLYPDIDVDLFASYANKKLDQFVSWHHDPFAVHVDAFSLDWNQFNLPYAFPPNSILMRVFQQLRRDRTDMILVVPVWPTQPW